MDPYLDHLSFRYSMMLGSPRRMHAILPIEPGQLPKPLEDAAKAMDNAKSDGEARMAASEFLTLSEEWVDSGRHAAADEPKAP